jgi:hypothetical protein
MANKTFKPDEGWGGKEVEDPLLLGLCLHVFDRADLQLRETKGSHGGKKGNAICYCCIFHSLSVLYSSFVLGFKEHKTVVDSKRFADVPVQIHVVVREWGPHSLSLGSDSDRAMNTNLLAQSATHRISLGSVWRFLGFNNKKRKLNRLSQCKDCHFFFQIQV